MKNNGKLDLIKTSINFDTATKEEISVYLHNVAKNYKPSGKNDPVLVIRRERGYRN